MSFNYSLLFFSLLLSTLAHAQFDGPGLNLNNICEGMPSSGQSFAEHASHFTGLHGYGQINPDDWMNNLADKWSSIESCDKYRQSDVNIPINNVAICHNHEFFYESIAPCTPTGEVIRSIYITIFDCAPVQARSGGLYCQCGGWSSTVVTTNTCGPAVKY